MSEQTMRRRIVRDLKPYHGIAVENPVLPGTPDINCTLGWIELKWLRRWPQQENTLVKISHFTPQQRLWLRKRWLVDGRAWLFLQVGREWLLFDGCTAAQEIGKRTRDELFELAVAKWPNGLSADAFRKKLKQLSEASAA